MFDIHYEYDVKKHTYVAIGTLSEQAKNQILDNWDEIRAKTGVKSIDELMHLLKKDMEKQLQSVLDSALGQGRDNRWRQMDAWFEDDPTFPGVKKLNIEIFHNGMLHTSTIHVAQENFRWEFRRMILDDMVEHMDRQLGQAAKKEVD